MGEITFVRDTSNYQRETVSTGVFEAPPRLAVIVGLVLPETRCVLMVNVADVVPAATVTLAGTVLEAGRVIASFCVDAERRKSLGGAHLDLDLSPSRIV